MGTPNTLAVRAVLDNQNIKKATEHLLGICHGLAADKALNDHEIYFLNTWIKQNSEVTSAWPGKQIARRVHEILADGIITEEERESLLSTLTSACHSDFQNTGDASGSTAIPFDDDPHIIFEGRTYCFTGNFYFGTRSACERVVEKLGAITKPRVTTSLDYLIVGSQISSDWKYSSFGTKIIAAMEHNDNGHGIALISEHQWFEAINQHTS